MKTKQICLCKKGGRSHVYSNKIPTSFDKNVILNTALTSHQKQRLNFCKQPALKLQQYKSLKRVKNSIKRLKYLNKI